MKNEYKGIIIKESLIDVSILDKFRVADIKVSNSLNWTILTGYLDKDLIEGLSTNLKSDKWFVHFWNDTEIIIVFNNKIFNVKIGNKEELKLAIDYGRSIGLPDGQLDFPIK